MKALKDVIKAALNNFGYDVRKIVENTVPVEFSKDEMELYNHVFNNRLSMASAEGLYATMLACKHVIENSIEGDFVECGVWRGGHGIAAAGLFKLHGVNKKTYLFDTFKGMTEPSPHDVALRGAVKASEKFHENQRDGHNEWCFASRDDVRRNFEAAGLLDETIVFVEGDVLSTLKDARNIPQTIAVLRLDTDWYESTKYELDTLYPRLSPGGVLIVDDYGHWAGARRAVDEYFKTHGKRPFLNYTDYTVRTGVKT